MVERLYVILPFNVTGQFSYEGVFRYIGSKHSTKDSPGGWKLMSVIRKYTE